MKTVMGAVHLICMPNYSFAHQRHKMPPLSLACLAANLKKNGIEVAATDFRMILPDITMLSSHSHPPLQGKSFVAEIPDLTLILGMVKNFKNGKHLLSGIDEIIEDYVKYGSINFFELREGINRAYTIMDEQAKHIAANSIVGFSTVISNLFFTVMMSLMLRQERNKIKIIYGGPQTDLSLNSAKLVLKLGIADLVVCGEGEETLVKAIKSLEKGVKGGIHDTISYNDKKDLFQSVPSKDYPDLGVLPDPDFTIFDLDKYSQSCLPIYAGRGCVFKCKYCTYHKSVPYRIKNYIKTVDTMERLNEKYHTYRFFFSDSAMNIDNEWLEGFSDELIKRQCKVQWWGFFKPWMDTKLLEKLVRSGLFSVTVGAESFSDYVLAQMGKKNLTGEQVVRSLEIFCSMDISVNVGIITGFPGERKKDFIYTWKELRRLQEKFPDNLSINPQVFQLRASSDCYDNHANYKIKIFKWGRPVINTMKETRSIVENLPMGFVVDSPSVGEAMDRLILMNNIAIRPERILKNSDKQLTAYILSRIKESAKIRIASTEYKIFKINGPAPKNLFLLQTDKAKMLITEEEKDVFLMFNGEFSILEIIGKISREYGKTDLNSLGGIVKFLSGLNDNNVRFEIDY